ncbi:MAG: methionine synthase [Chloroflexi bacterium]|nr:methionine synthase [Chloroflexota bacterium]
MTSLPSEWAQTLEQDGARTRHTFSFHPNFLPTAVGSLPHTDPVAACALVKAYLPEIPCWPQLPRRDARESMYAQYSRGFPGIVIEDARVYVDRTRDLDPELADLYARHLDDDIDAGAIHAEYAAGLAQFLSMHWENARAVKGQIIGPISWGLTVTDQDRRSILYDDVLADAVAIQLSLQAAWQERELRKLAPETILFLDEPYLASFGSAYVAVEREQVISSLDQVFARLHGIKGLHCCGNTDWSLLLSTSLDILNFDAYNYAETLALYPDALRAFLERGGVIAWGIVPVQDDAHVMAETAESLVERLNGALQHVASKGVPLAALRQASLITPACGMGTLSERGAERALKLLVQVSERMREK